MAGTPVDYDPFAGGEPVDYDPFAASAGGETVDYDPFEQAEETVPKDKERDLSDELVRQGGLTLRSLTQGVLGFPLLIGDAANSVLNFIPGVNLGSPTRIVREGLTEAGLPEPETATERVVGLSGEALAGAGAGIKTASKLVTNEVTKRFLTEEAGQQLAAGAAAGAGVGAAQEAELGPAGTLIVGLAAGLAGAKGTSMAHTKLGQWADARAVSDKPVTIEEVRTVSKENGIQQSDEELRRMTETLEELRTAQKVDDEIARLTPKADDPVEVARFKSRELKKLGATAGGRTVDQARALQRMRKQDIERIEAKVRALQERKAQADVKMKEAAKLDAALQAGKQQQNILGQPPVEIKGVGNPGLMSTWGNDVISRIENVSPRLGIAVRRVSQRTATRTSGDIHRIDKFYKSKLYNTLSKSQRVRLDRALLNGDTTNANAIMGSVPGLKELYDSNVRKLLSDIQKDRIAGGADGFLESYHPRVVRRLKALQKSRGKDVKGDVEQALADATRRKKAKGEGPLTEQEIAAAVGKAIGGRPLKVLKDRRINEITPEMQKYYATSRDSLIDYVHNHHGAVATRDFFKSSLGVERQLGQTMDEDALHRLLAAELKSGNLTGKQLDELVPLLAAQFGVSRHAVGGFQHAVKNFFTASTLGSPLSTLTQFGDIAPVMSKFGIRNTLASMFSKNALDVYDAGVRELSKDARTAHGSARLVRDVLAAIGFNKLDKMMANTGVNAAFRKWTVAAQKNPKATAKQLREWFGDDTEKVVGELSRRELTDDVKTLMMHEMGGIRPVGREDMPLFWQQHPNGRWIFSLLSWTLKQMNYVRNTGLKDLRAGKKTRTAIDLLKFMALMGLTNGVVQDSKDWIHGRDIDPASNFVTGALSLGMSGKFVVDALNRGEGAGALGAIVPMIGIMGETVQTGIWDGVLKGEWGKVLDAFPATRNLKALAESDVAGVAAALPLAAISAAGAATLPPGAEPLPPQYTQEQVEYQQQQELPTAVTVPKNTAEQFKVAKDHLVLREGDRDYVYLDTLGFPTAGIGHKLTKAEKQKYSTGDKVPADVRDRWFKQDSAKAFAAAKRQAKEIGRPDMVPALTSVNFQLGTGWNKDHSRTWEYLKQGDWTSAAMEAANSRWNAQTPVRVKDFQQAILAGIRD